MNLANLERTSLIFCSIFAVAGNILYSYSLKLVSLKMAFLGRFLIGLGSAEVFNRQILSILPEESANTECAHLAKASMITTALSFVFGSLFDVKVSGEGRVVLIDNSVPFGQHNLLPLKSIGFIMAAAWFMHLIGTIFFFDMPKDGRGDQDTVHPPELKMPATQEEDFDSDDDADKHEAKQPYIPSDGTFEKLQTMSRKTVKRQSIRTGYRESIANVRQIMFSNIAFPTTIAILFIAKATSEVLLASCGTITSRYFSWSGAR